MLMKAYSVKDEKVGVFFQPFFAPHDIVAIRMFQGSLRSKDTLLSEYPEDYALYRIGLWAEMTGKVIPENPPVRLGYAYEYLQDKPVEEEELLVFPPDNYAEEEDEEEDDEEEDEPG